MEWSSPISNPKSAEKISLMASVETNGGYAPTNSGDPLTAAGRSATVD
jgi:hypothetical protein